MLELFGTPDQPKLPESVTENSELGSILDLEKIKRSAGAVGRSFDKVEQGLYRKHCVHCHGMSGDGAGPAAYFQYPYPRDFRRGTFKFKSTAYGAKPTHDDLLKVLENGLPGTAMPSFRLLKESKYYAEDIEALVHYVRYLSVRGEVERRLMMKGAQAVEDQVRLLDPKYRAPSEVESNSEGYQRQKKETDRIVQTVLESWRMAPEKTIKAERPASRSFDIPGDFATNKASELKSSIARGQELFVGGIANCSSCHGKQGLGNGTAQDFDEWSKDWTIRAGIDPKNKSEWRSMRKFGAMNPRKSLPRNLHLGVFRGGGSPEDIYRRIVGGIDGTPMPPAAVQPANSQGMTEEQVWDLVNYVLSLQYKTEGAS